MKPTLATLGLVSFGIAAFLCLPRATRERVSAPAKTWAAGHFERIMAKLPEDAPPKLIMSVLPRLREQNDRIVELLQEQNSLLREYQRTAGKQS